MKDEKYITLKEVRINNNCPECFNTNGLHITYKQKFIETSFYKSITKETTQQIECKTCNTIIYPVRWTNDIERVFEYHNKSFTPKNTSLKLKQKAWIFISIALVTLLVGITLLVLNL